MIRLLQLLRDLFDTKEPSIRARKKLIESAALQSTLKPPQIPSARALPRGIVR